MPSTSFQAILAKALTDYCEQIGVDLDKHPFSDELRGCNSPDDVLGLLEVKANTFKLYRDGNRKLIDWLNPVVQAIHALSGVIGEAVRLIGQGCPHCVELLIVRYQVPFSPAKLIFVGMDVLITVRPI